MNSLSVPLCLCGFQPVLAVLNVDGWILAFSAITVVATIFMGFWTAKRSKTASDFFVAGRSVSVGWNASAISGEYLSAASFMGIAGMVMSSGYDALWYPVCYACGYLFLLLFIAGPLRRFGAYTIPDFAEGRFDSPVFRKIAVVFVLFIGFFYTMPQMKGAGTTLAYIFPGLPYWAGVVLVGAVITLNVALGGMKGITLVQAFQYWMKMFAISVPIFVLMAVYGHYGKQMSVTGPEKPDFSTPIAISENPSIEEKQRFDAINNAKQWEMYLERKPLPLKAPADATWLNPFGPLTTKAAKTAAAAIGKQATLANPFAATVFPDDWRSLSGATSLVSVSTSMTLPAVNGWVTLEPPPSLARAEDRLKAVFGQAQHYSVGNAKLVSVLMDYARLSGRKVIANTNLGLTRLLGSLQLNWNERATLVSDLERFLATNGIALRQDAAGSLRAMTQEQVAKWDRSGDPSAVADPKGPVWRGEDTVPYLTSAISLRAGLSPDQRMTVNFDSPSIAQVLAIYADLTGRQLLPRTNSIPERVDALLLGTLSRWKLISPPAVPDSGVREHGDGAFTAAEVKAAIEAQLRTHGLAVAPVGEKGFRVVAAEVTRLPSNGKDQSLLTSAATNAEKAWLDKHEKPLALVYTYSLIIAIVCGTAGLPHILVRFYTNPDGTAAKKTTMWVMILIGMFYVFPPVFGALGRNLLPDLYNGVGAKGTDKIVLELPRILNAKYPPLGSILSGITCAGAFAAFMSTFSGLLVSMTGALAHDVYGRILRPKATQDERMRMFKIGAVIIGAIAILLGMQVEQLQINFMVGQAFAIAAASYFPLLFMAVWWRKLTMKGAATGMLTGGLAALLCISLTSFSDLATAPKASAFFTLFAGLNPFWAAHPLLRILCEQPAIWAVPLAITLMVIVSKLTAHEVPGDIHMKMLVLHAPEQLGLKQEYIQEHQAH
jgi:Na+(H+)/acetate symporter ActP